LSRPPSLALPSDPIPVQLNNKATWNEKRSPDRADFYTIGYMRRGLDDFIRTLKDVDVTTLVDIRQTPVSMYKPEFSKTSLQQHLAGC
jgi:hypothetical protein